jgi:ATP/maltotriose-dependent transcriptional regulator MalT
MTIALIPVDEFGQVIVFETTRSARKIVAKYGMNPEESTELTSFLTTEIWSELHKKRELQTLAMVRRLIKLRQVDYFRNKGRFDNQTPFCAFDHDSENSGDGQSSKTMTLETRVKSNVNVESEVLMSNDLQSFLLSLNTRQRQILNLINQGYGNNEICQILDVSINTPKNTMKKVRELALAFGLKIA